MPPELTIIIPCYNESRTIRQVVQRVVALEIDRQIIVVDDGSTDGTAEIVKELEAVSTDVEAVLLVANQGKGSAIRAGLGRANGRYTIVQDADDEYDPHDILSLLAGIRDKRNTIVYGARRLHVANRRRVFDLGVSAINCIAAVVYGIKLRDIMTCYKLVPTEILQAMDLQCTGFEFCTEVTAKASRMGLHVLEMPVSYRPRLRERGKKVRISHGPSVVFPLWKYRKWRPKQAITR